MTNYQYMIAMVCYLKACKPHALTLVNGRLSYEKIIEEANLKDLVEEHQFYSLYYLKKLIRFDLGSEETRKEILEEREIQLDNFGRTPKDMIIKINSWLSEVNNG
ncbi:hypothetical protein [uncultured Photobacterium sp.]|uniref:hypothetical protein n=1 Tax=uncultured Photobacterium sp. TaxID=173973 RepID=UPI00260FD93F|nr:hypothetical protein [uncultured Photobacterium sp.]